MASDVKRSSDRFKGHTKTSYKLALYTCDKGMWTVIEVTEKPIFQAASEGEALQLIKRMGGEVVR